MVDRRAVVVSLLAFVVAGLSDTMAVVLPIVLVGLLVALPAARRRCAWALIGATVGLLVVALAPGNAVRRSLLPPPDLWLSLTLAAQVTGSFAATALRQAPLSVAAVALVPLLTAGDVVTDRGVRGHLKRSLLIVTLTALAMSYGANFLGFYAASSQMGGRAAVVPTAIVVLCLFVASHLAGRLWRVRSRRAAQVLIVAAAVTGAIQAIQIGDTLGHWAEVEFVPRTAYVEACRREGGIQAIFP